MDTTNPGFMASFNELVNNIAAAGNLPAAQAKTQAVAALAGQAKLHAAVAGIDDAFYITTVITIAGVILSFFLRDVRKDKAVKAEKSAG